MGIYYDTTIDNLRLSNAQALADQIGAGRSAQISKALLPGVMGAQTPTPGPTGYLALARALTLVPSVRHWNRALSPLATNFN